MTIKIWRDFWLYVLCNQLKKKAMHCTFRNDLMKNVTQMDIKENNFMIIHNIKLYLFNFNKLRKKKNRKRNQKEK